MATDFPLGKEKTSGMGSSWPQFARRPVDFVTGRPWELIFPAVEGSRVAWEFPAGDGEVVRLITPSSSVISQLHPSFRLCVGIEDVPGELHTGLEEGDGRSSTTAARTSIVLWLSEGSRVVKREARSEEEGVVRRDA